MYVNVPWTDTVTSADTGTPAILSSGGLPTLNTGITAAEVRTAIGAGTFSTGNGSLLTNLIDVNVLVANHIDANAITAEKIASSSITAEELAISNSSSGSQGIYFSTTAIEIRDANRVRVKIGAL